MKPVFLWRVFILIACIPVHPVAAVDLERGKQLHDEHCVRCHSSEIYARENSIIFNYRDLEQRIRQCELGNELAWFDEEIEDVLTYLNNNYYGFEIPAQE